MLELYKPKIEDLWFREKFMGDEKTMSYNHAWGGTIPFPESMWEDWYSTWVLSSDGSHYYRYLRDKDSGVFVGEIAYHIDTERDMCMADIIIDARFRGRGYGKKGLMMLCEAAEENGIDVLYDDIALDNPATGMFQKCGFTEEYRTEEIIMLRKHLGRNDFDTEGFLRAVLTKDRKALPDFFHTDAIIRWHCSNEEFTVPEYVRANCEYPGEWDGETERVERNGDILILASRVFPKDSDDSYHVVSFVKVRDGRIAELDEYWADDGEAPPWRKDMKIGRPIR